MAGTFLPKPLVADFNKTFGILRFQRSKFETFEKDAEGNDTKVVKFTHIDIKSSAQKGSIPVKVKGTLPKNMKFGAQVELVNPVIEPYAIQQGDSNRYNGVISITVDSIKTMVH